MTAADQPPELRDDRGYFLGWDGRDCGEHRTVGTHRAWCYDCGEWCYPGDSDAGCSGCELPAPRRIVEAVRALCEQARKVSPSPAMNLYLGDVEQALGLRTESTRGIVGQREASQP